MEQSKKIQIDHMVTAWGPASVWVFVILVFSVLPYKAHPPLTIGHLDKAFHFFEYTLLAFLAVRGLFSMGVVLSPKNALFTLILSGGYGIVLELVQLFVPGRSASLHDAAANVAGAVFGILLGKAILWQK